MIKIEDKELRFLEIEDFEYRTDDKILSGYGMKWEKLSQEIFGFKEKFAKGAFSKSIRKNNIFSYFNHNDDIVLGSTDSKTLDVEENDLGLRFKINLPNTTSGNDIHELVRKKIIKGTSIGFITRKDRWEHKEKEPSIRTIEEADLIELSPTPRPAYTQTYISARSVNPLKKHLEEKKIIEERQNNIQKNNIVRNNQIRENLLKNKGVI